MGLEAAGFISELVVTNPTGADDYSTADDHIRLVKAVLQGQFPNFGAVAVNATPEELDKLDGFTGLTADLNILSAAAAAGLTATELLFLNGVTSDLQAQLDAKAASAHNHAAVDVNSGAFVDARIAESNVTQHVAAIDHDLLLNFVGDKHIDWTLTGAEDVHADRFPAATESVKGVIERATQVEVDAGTDDLRAFSPLKFKTSPGGWLTGSFVPTFTGFSTDPASPTIRWTISGNQVTLYLDFSNGTSNATTFTITNVPAAIRPSRTHILYVGGATDNGANIDGCTLFINTTGTITFGAGHLNLGGGGWNAASALKGINQGGQAVTYILDDTA